MATVGQTATSHEAALSVRGLTIDLPKGMERAMPSRTSRLIFKRGQILCIVGESGSGKSVTANTIMGLLPKSIPVSSGAIHLGGRGHGHHRRITGEAARSARPRRVHDLPGSAFGAQPADDGRRADYGGHDRTWRRHEGLAAQARDRVADGSRSARSGAHVLPISVPAFGRAAPARDDRHGPGARTEVLIADEPTTALDVTTQAQILQLIRDIQRRKGMSVMFITHDFGVVAEIADSVVVMEKGRIVEQGSADAGPEITRPSLYKAPHRGRSRA